MKDKKVIITVVIAGVLIGLLGFKALSQAKNEAPAVIEEPQPEEIEPLDPSVTVSVTKSRVKDNTLALSISGLGGKYQSVAYEISYDTQGITQGVTSKPLDIAGKDSFVRDDIYLGTCSRNVCKPHLGVKKVSLVLVFTAASGSKSQFSRDFDL